MSFQKSLGKVKGDAGIAYIPVITTAVNGQQYLSFTASDNSTVPNSLQDIPIPSFVYKPSLDNNGHLIFTLTQVSSLDNQSTTMDIGNVKGEAGTSVINTRIVTELPDPETDNLSDEDKQALYIINTGNAYADVAIYNTAYDEDNTEEPFIFLESMTHFDNYYTKAGAQEVFYTKQQVQTQLGYIAEQQTNIQSLIGNPPTINIPDDNS